VSAPAPDFELPSVQGGPARLSDLLAAGRVLLLFAHSDCPTSLLALDRLAPLASDLERAGVRLVVVAQETPEAAARLARRHGVTSPVLAEAAPYSVSDAYGIDAVPTAVLVGPDGAVLDRVVGWDTDRFVALLPVPPPEGEPRWKPGCEGRNRCDYGPSRDLDELEEMFELGWTDGLPVVPPTAERVEAMLGGRDPGTSLGEVPPAMGEATLGRVAACAVLAGCRPEHFPVVLAAVRALLDPAYNLNALTVTTSPPGQVVVVNGPVRRAIGLNSGMGALGPGFRSNLTIGRALRLVATLTGGGAPGRLDRSTLGHPGKLSFCVAENEEASPWEPLHVERGFPAGASTVTLLAGDAPLSISDHRSTTPDELAATLGWAAAAQWSPFWWPLDAVSLFVICPEHAAVFGEAGWTKEDLRQAIFADVRRPAQELKRGETTAEVLAARDDELIAKWASPDRIMIVVAGGEAGRFSAVIGPSLSMDTAVLTREV
jgi:peroxiredoxin